MVDRAKKPRRRSAPEWARLVAAWKESGKSAADFAAMRGIEPGRLTWWKWKLTCRTVASTEDLRLVEVETTPAEAAPTTTTATVVTAPAWEITSARGDVLRVYRSIAPEELAAVLSALRTSGDH